MSNGEPNGNAALDADPMAELKVLTNNEKFQVSWMTWVALLLFVAFYPGISLLGFAQNPADLLGNLTETVLVFMLIVTVLFQWGLFLFNYLAVYLEHTGLAGIGFNRIRLVHVAWAIAFLLASNLILSGLGWLLAQIGLPLSGDIMLLVPKETSGKLVWIVVSITAGICEEVGFRGYMMSRLRLVFRTKTWLVPVVVSSLAFGVCHAYQGFPGLILLTIYGAMFGLLYIRTGSIWPCIIAHSLNDLGALFYPH